MTATSPNSLSTDRCRELAVAVFSYRPSLVTKSRARSALFAAATEIDRLRAVIENAPHMESCRRFYLSPPSAKCTCWKTEAL